MHWSLLQFLLDAFVFTIVHTDTYKLLHRDICKVTQTEIQLISLHLVSKTLNFGFIHSVKIEIKMKEKRVEALINCVINRALQ